MLPKLAIILGPTGIGKSEVALEVAQEIGGEIINADSQQIYRHLDIGTGKPSSQQQRVVPHHLLNIAEPTEKFNAALFLRLALKSIEDIQSHGKKAIVCGGTGLYLRVLTRGLFVGPSRDIRVRERLEAEGNKNGLESLYERLRVLDPEIALRVHPHDRQRIIRALEVIELTGKKMSAWQEEHGFHEARFQCLKIGLCRERKELYERINKRCDKMIRDGLVEEVKSLISRGYDLDLRPLRSVGYRQMGLHLRGELNWDEAVQLMKRDTRRLAKRQLTWFRSDREIHWFHPERDLGTIKEKIGLFFVSNFA